MKNLLRFSCIILMFNSNTALAQVTSPITTCPTVLAVARNGLNDYNNEPVNLYNVNISTGAATIIPGGPLKLPGTNTNTDFNAVGVNSFDGFIYGIRPSVTPTPSFYRVGTNYSIAQIGNIAAPVPVGNANVGIVNSAAGEFDAADNYYFTAFTGAVGFPPSFTAVDFYIGKISAVSARTPGSSTITPTYVKLNYGAGPCGEYYQTLIAPTTAASQNTGIRDIAFNPQDGKIYSYVTYELPASPGTFKGQLISADLTTGNITCYPSAVLPFANASNEVAGVAFTSTGQILVLFTGGAVYKTVMSGTNVFTGAITLAGNSGITGGLRGDFAACVTASAVPVTFESVSAREVNCSVKVNWTVSQEQNVSKYQVEIADKSGQFISAADVPARNSSTVATYTLSVPVVANSMSVRVRQISSDNSSSVSEVVRINTSCENTGITVLSNMAVREQLQFRFNNLTASQRFNVRILSATGSQVLQQQLRADGLSTLQTLNTANLTPGVYFLSVQSESGLRYSEKFIKK